jgi:hypothetical protein
MALPTELLSKAKIHCDRLRVTDMQKTIRLWWKPRDQRIDTSGLQISLNLCAQEVTAKLRGHSEP